MVLAYSAIDILGALDSADGVATRDTFVSWANRYMDPAGALGCSGLELYSARCGLLHNWSPSTRLTKAGIAREFIYVLDRPLSQPKQSSSGPVIIHPPWLWLSFRDGSSRFVAETTNDSARLLRVNKNLERQTRGRSAPLAAERNAVRHTGGIYDLSRAEDGCGSVAVRRPGVAVQRGRPVADAGGPDPPLRGDRAGARGRSQRPTGPTGYDGGRHHTASARGADAILVGAGSNERTGLRRPRRRVVGVGGSTTIERPGGLTPQMEPTCP